MTPSGSLKMAFFTLGNHHDFAVMEVSGAASSKDEHGVGLDHVAFKIGTNLDELREELRRGKRIGRRAARADLRPRAAFADRRDDGRGITACGDLDEQFEAACRLRGAIDHPRR